MKYSGISQDNMEGRNQSILFERYVDQMLQRKWQTRGVREIQ